MTTPLERITARVAPFAAEDESFSPSPLLTLPEFFDGNETVGSILCNVWDPEDPEWSVTPAEVRTALAQIEARDDVVEVRIAVTQFDDPDWPFSDTVVLVTNTAAGADDITSWFTDGRMAPDEVEDPADPTGFEAIQVPPECRLVVLWWD